jgi:hypothetical protein
MKSWISRKYKLFSRERKKAVVQPKEKTLDTGRIIRKFERLFGDSWHTVNRGYEHRDDF